MSNFNKAILIGHLTRDPESKVLPSGTTVASSGLAVTEKRKDREDTLFIEWSAFGKTADTMAQYLSKGSNVLLEGRLKLDQWNAQDGSKRSRISLIVDRFAFIGPKREQPGHHPGYEQRQVPDDDNPF